MNELRGEISSAPEIRVQIVGSGPPGPVGPKGSSPYVGENGNWWVDGEDTGSPVQTGDHRVLQGRDQPNQHPIDAIDGLREVIENLPAAMSADELRKILMNGGNRNAR